MSIADLEVGQTAVVDSLERTGSTTRRRLLALGLVPGERVVLEQRFPAYVVRVGWTQVALDHDTATMIMVHPEPATPSSALD